MAIRTFNSVGGFSVGETPVNIILANGDITTANIALTGNISAGNIKTDNYLYANGAPVDFQQAAGSNTQIQFNNNNDFGASANFTFDSATNILLLNGTANIANINISGKSNLNSVSNITITGGSSGQVLTTDGAGNLSFATISTTSLSNGTSNIQVLNNGNITLSSAGNANVVVVTGTGAVVNGTLDISGTVTAPAFTANTGVFTGNGSGLTQLTGANVTGTVANATYATSAGSATTAGTVTTNAQPNITSVGTLTSLDINGTATAVAFTANTGVFTGNGSGLTQLTGANVTGTVANATYATSAGSATTATTAGTVTTNAQPNITSVGTLTSLDVNGTVTAVAFTANTGVFTGNGSGLTQLTGANVTGTVANATYATSAGTAGSATTAGTVTTNAQPNITSVGTLSSLTVTANISGGNIDTGGIISATGNITGGNLVTTNGLYAGDATITGNLTVGGNTTYINVTNLSVKDPLIELGGSANGGNASAYDGKDRGLILHNYYANGSGPYNQAFVWTTANGEFTAIANASVTGEVVTVNELGNLRANIVIADLSGGILTSAQPNITSVGTLSSLDVTANANVGNINATGVANISGNVIGGNLTTGGVVAATGNVSGGNLTTGGVVAATGNVSGGNITSTGLITTTGNLVGNNAVISNNVGVGSTNINWATVTTTATTANQAIATISTTGIRGVEFLVKGEEAAGGKYSIATISAVHNGSSVDYAVYGTVALGGSTGSLSVNYSSSNITLNVTPASSNSTVWVTQYRTI